MCTVTFIPRSNGFLLGMNRDEHWERGRQSRAPEMHTREGVAALYPTDRDGGTWIAVNDHRLAFAILNRNFSGDRFPKLRTRGQVIPQLLGCGSIGATSDRLGSLPLAGTLPFTLLAFSAGDQQIKEARFDGHILSFADHAWERQHWFSSGLSDKRAQRERAPLVQQLLGDADCGSALWMRRLHRVHGDAAGPFSICVHRDDVGSVSYSEVDVTSTEVRFSYAAGSPCQQGAFSTVKLLAA